MKPKAALASLVTRASLEKQAGERYFARGVAYLRAGAVAHLRADERGIRARVVGTEPYVARLCIEAGKLDWGYWRKRTGTHWRKSSSSGSPGTRAC